MVSLTVILIISAGYIVYYEYKYEYDSIVLQSKDTYYKEIMSFTIDGSITDEQLGEFYYARESILCSFETELRDPSGGAGRYNRRSIEDEEHKIEWEAFHQIELPEIEFRNNRYSIAIGKKYEVDADNGFTSYDVELRMVTVYLVEFVPHNVCFMLHYTFFPYGKFV